MKSGTLYRRARQAGVRSSRVMETLEARTLFSANVTGSVTAGVLSLKGDSCNDNIVIDQAGLSATQFRVSSGDGKTLINGTLASVVFSDVTGLSINTGAGNDTVQLNNANVTKDVVFSGATGNQIVALVNDVVGGNFSLTSSGAQNSTDLESTTVNGSVSVSVGAGYNTGCGGWCVCSTFGNANEIFTLGNGTVNGDLSLTNSSGQTTTSVDSSIVAGNVTVTNGANSYGNRGYNCHTKCGTTVNAGDMFTMTGTTVVGNMTISNATDGNSTDIESSVVIGAVSVSNVVKTTNQSNFCSSYSCNIAGASDDFTVNQSFLGSDLAINNISDGASATFSNSSIAGSVSINNGVGTQGRGYTSCGGQNSDQFGDFLTMNGANVGGSMVVNNGSTYNNSDVENTSISGDITVGNGLNYLSQATTTKVCGGYFSYSCNPCGSNSRYVVTDDIFTMSNSEVGGNLTISNANGVTSTTIDHSQIMGSVTVTNAAGTNNFEMSFTIVGNDLTFTAGKGSTTATVSGSVIGGDADFNVASNASVSIDPSEVDGTTTIS